MTERIEFAIGVGGEGTPISLKKGSSVTWGQRYGVNPFVSEIETDLSRAVEIYESSRFEFPSDSSAERGQEVGPLTIFAKPSQGRQREFRNLFALALMPGGDPQMGRLLIVDSRYWWRYLIVDRAYNVRRSSGDRRLQGGALVPLSVRESEPDFDYRPSSIHPEEFEPFTPLEALVDVMDLLEGGEDSYTIPGGVVTHTDWPDGVTLRDRGHLALERLLSYLPGVQPYQTEAGHISFSNVYDQTEEAVATAALGRQNSGSVWRVDRRAARWRKAQVYVPRLFEFRADFEDRGAAGQQNSQVRGQEPPNFLNVIRCPLYLLPLPSGEDATLGELIQWPIYVSAFNAFRTTKTLLQSAPALTDAIVREHWLGKWEGLIDSYTLLTNGKARDAEVALLLGAIRTDWRQTFQLVKEWMARIQGLLAIRVAVLNPERGTGSPSPVFTQWVEKLTHQGVSYRADELGIQHDDWAEDLSGAKSSPFEVRVLDAEAGVFRLEARPDQDGTASSNVIGKAESIPGVDINQLENYWAEISVSDSFRCAVIFSAVLDAPNSIRRLKRIEVTAEEAAEVLGVEGPGESLGPDLEMFVGLEPARLAYMHSAHQQILDRAFGVFEGEEADESESDLWVNRERLQALARAAAATELAPLLDRVQGSLHLSHFEDVHPTGSLSRVVFTVQILPQGTAVAQTHLEFPGEVQGPDPWSLLPEQARRVLRNQVIQ